MLAAVAVCQGRAGSPRSSITIHVHKGGFFSSLGHDHTVEAPFSRVLLNARARTVEVVVVATQMKVVDDDVSPKDRADIQKSMLGPEVLDASRFPEIRFQSSRVDETSTNRYRVTGKLDLHGVTRDLSFDVSKTGDGAYSGKTKLKQTDFGIKPFSAGGVVKIKDELELEFHVSL